MSGVAGGGPAAGGPWANGGAPGPALPPDPEVVAAIMAALAAGWGTAGAGLRVLRVEPAGAGSGPGVGMSAWALAGRIQQMRGLARPGR